MNSRKSLRACPTVSRSLIGHNFELTGVDRWGCMTGVYLLSYFFKILACFLLKIFCEIILTVSLLYVKVKAVESSDGKFVEVYHGEFSPKCLWHFV